VRAWPILAAVAGLAVVAGLVGYFGADAVARSLLAVGGVGFAAVCAIHLILIGVAGLAWRALLPGAGAAAAMWARLVRDSGSEALPLSQVGGFVLGARALTLAGVPASLATASTIVDVTIEFVAQLAYTALGLVLLVRLQPETRAAAPMLLGLAIAALAAAAFVLVQRRGFVLVERMARILGEGAGWAARGTAGAAVLHAALADIYRRRAGLWIGFALHLACWIGSAVEVWVALRIARAPLSFGAVLAIESMLYAIRAAAFAVPQAVGVQEGAYILLGASFGLSSDMALALSLLKRARDLAIGLPTIAVWHAIESRRLLLRRGAARPAAPGPDTGPDAPPAD
jgi:putative membrane protein